MPNAIRGVVEHLKCPSRTPRTGLSNSLGVHFDMEIAVTEVFFEPPARPQNGRLGEQPRKWRISDNASRPPFPASWSNHPYPR